MNSSKEVLADGLTREFLHEGKIAAYQMLNMRRETVAAWGEDAGQVLQDWDAETPFLFLVDVSGGELVITPYLRETVKKITRIRPDVEGRVAAVVPKGFFVQMVRGMLRLQSYRKSKRVRQVFFDREEAINWLREAI